MREPLFFVQSPINQPDGPIYLAGEHMSYVTGWQEGAILSAHEVIRHLQQIVLKS